MWCAMRSRMDETHAFYFYGASYDAPRKLTSGIGNQWLHFLFARDAWRIVIRAVRWQYGTTKMMRLQGVVDCSCLALLETSCMLWKSLIRKHLFLPKLGRHKSSGGLHNEDWQEMLTCIFLERPRFLSIHILGRKQIRRPERMGW